MLGLLKRLSAAIPPAEPGPDGTAPTGLAAGPCQVISDAARIERTLLDLGRSQAHLTLNARGQGRLHQVRLKAVDPLQRQMLVTQLWSDAEHAALMADRHVNLSASHQGVPVFFSVDVAGTGEIGGTPCYRMPFPDWILAMEMRECLRVRLPEELNARLQCRPPPGLQVEARVMDISEAGLSFVLPSAMAEPMAGLDTALPAQLFTQQGTVAALQLRPRRYERLGDSTLVGAAIELDSELGRQGLRRLILAHQRRRLRLQ